MLRLADAEHLTAIKWSVPQGADYDEMIKFAHIFNVIDNTSQPVRCHKNGGRGYISRLIAAYPPHDMEVWQLLEAGQYEEAQARLDHANNAIEPVRAKIGAVSGGYRFGKGLSAALGRPVGPPRPPTLPMDEAEIAELREVVQGLGWLD
jgi:dihydrodipicolinate synthase/N-acetylneuraminate lyase